MSEDSLLHTRGVSYTCRSLEASELNLTVSSKKIRYCTAEHPSSLDSIHATRSPQQQISTRGLSSRALMEAKGASVRQRLQRYIDRSRTWQPRQSSGQLPHKADRSPIAVTPQPAANHNTSRTAAPAPYTLVGRVIFYPRPPSFSCFFGTRWVVVFAVASYQKNVCVRVRLSCSI